MDTRMWEEQFPVIMRNVINAGKKHHTKLVFFDNTYIVPPERTGIDRANTVCPRRKKGDGAESHGGNAPVGNERRTNNSGDLPRPGVLWSRENTEHHQHIYF